MQLNKKNKRLALATLIVGYCLAFGFISLVALNIKPEKAIPKTEQATPQVEKNSTKTEFIYVDREVILPQRDTLYSDRLTGVIIDEEPHVAVVKNGHRGVIDSHTDYFTTDKDIVIDKSRRGAIAENDLIYENHKTKNTTHNRDINVDTVGGLHGDGLRGNSYRNGHDITDHFGMDREPDLLEKRLHEIEKEGIGIDNKEQGIDLSKLTIAKDNEDFEIDVNLDQFKNNGQEGAGKGQLYAYNFPRLGVGAGIGNAALGAGAGGGAGISAGVGEAVMNGEAVPTLGGIGTSRTPLNDPQSLYGSKPSSGAQNASQGAPVSSEGVGGLVSGAGAGGAAGLMTDKVYVNLGVGSGNGYGVGRSGRGYNYDHLPKDGALHIMMHVDGSGSILDTRKQLDIMKDTILKTALLPYYKNDENLYNRRVTIVDGAGERTLRFFNDAAKKDNVLAIAFQDEAQPAYHLPNFNKSPEAYYVDDLGKLKSSLNGYKGIYRGVMFQVDRGTTFAKSFKEFVGNAFNGEGYLKNQNLKKYHRDNNANHIKNKNGIIFSDEYHAKDSGDPQYYLNLIFEASKRIGIDLDIYGAGTKDGKYIQSN